MDIINRVKNILLTPKTEWQAIEAENAPHAKVFTTYIVPLALIPAIATFIGSGIISGTMTLGIGMAIVVYISMLGGIYLTAFVINALAQTFGAKENFDKAFSLVAYSYTPALIAGIFSILPAISWIAMLIGLYCYYLLYIGMQPMMKQPAEKTVAYFIVSLIMMAVAMFAISAVLTMILVRALIFS